MAKIRLDQLLVEHGLAADVDQARRLILAGSVVAGDHRADKPGLLLDAATPLRLKDEPARYVSRGGLKLEAALRRFGLGELAGRIALDVGASTGGFSDCLLQHGAAHVWAVDTGRGQLHARLRTDPRLRLREQANARELTPEWFGGERIDLVAIDVAFISLRLILPPLPAVLAPEGSVVALVKPQFEAEPGQVGPGGVVRGRERHAAVLGTVLDFARAGGWRVDGLCPSPLPGPAGNLEFFAWLARENAPVPAAAHEFAIETVLDEAYTFLERPTRAPE